jgi:hypothetical protein
MRVCVVFRGENMRNKWGPSSALECIPNWKEAIFDVIDCDVAFFTYPSRILDELIRQVSPIHVCTSGYGSQETNTLAAINWMIENHNRYDRFVLLRFDFIYRKRITDWYHWNNKGVILANKDPHYPSIKLYADHVFIIDREYLHQFRNACIAEGRFKIGLHHIGGYLEEMPEVPLHLMYQDYYGFGDHPLYTYSFSPRPDLDAEEYQAPKLPGIYPNPSPIIGPPKKTAAQRGMKNNMKRTRPYVIFKNKK